MEMEEHFYSDDPSVGHPDVRTRLPDTEYFFLGNGHIQAAVQLCPSGEGTALGLLVMDPVRFGPKRAALTCDPESGLTETVLGVGVGDELFRPSGDSVEGRWEESDGIPAVLASWKGGGAQVEERFSCPPSGALQLHRRIKVRFSSPPSGPIRLQLGSRIADSFPIVPDGSGEAVATLIHEIRQGEDGVQMGHRWERGEGGMPDDGFWTDLTRIRVSDPGLHHLFSSARSQLPAAVDHQGRMDGSIWQYNLEWVRDQAHVAESFVRLGDHERARTMLTRLLDDFVSPDGDTVDSGQRRPAQDVELDQNGELLCALGTYVHWTGELELVRTRWDRIRALASFPLHDRFLHQESGLLHNRREYWERHGGHGIQDGFELMSQFFVAMGLESAAGLARALGHDSEGDQWSEAAATLKESLLFHPRFSLVENGHLIKRRGVDGAWQRTMEMPGDTGLPHGIPLAADFPHFLDPDASSALLVAYGFIDPAGELARKSLAKLEELWNQEWEGGGYARYNISSEPDSPGAWPFASLFVARAYAEARQGEKVMRILRWLETTQGGRAGAWFENDGPRISPPYPQLGFTPWTWAEMITLFVHHFLGVRPHSSGLTVRPWLPGEIKAMEANLEVRGHQLHLVLQHATSPETRRWIVEGEEQVWSGGRIDLPIPTDDLRVEAFL